MTEPARILLRDVVDAQPEGELERRLGEGRPLRVKLTIDPVAPGIHLGHTVALRKLREFQDHGHVGVLVLGDYTARVGDPSGAAPHRGLDPAAIDRNAEVVEREALALLDPDRTEVRRNGEWLDMAMEELFRLARTTTVAQLLEHEGFARRHADATPISILELVYPLLRGYDSVQVRADVEVGGTDQAFNLRLAREVQAAYGAAPQVALTVPVLAGTDGGRPMDAAFANHIGVTEPPEEIFGKTMSIPDEAMAAYYGLLLDREPDAARHPGELKRGLARELAALFGGGEEAGRSAEAHFDRLHVSRELPTEVEEAALPPGDPVHLPEALAGAFGISRSEARRLLAGGGVKVDGEPLDGARLDVPSAELEGHVVQLGKRRFKRLVAAADSR